MKFAPLILALFLVACSSTAQAEQIPLATATAQPSETGTPTPDTLGLLYAAQTREAQSRADANAAIDRLQAEESRSFELQKTAESRLLELGSLTATTQAQTDATKIQLAGIAATQEAFVVQATMTGDQNRVAWATAEAGLFEARAEYLKAETQSKTATGWLVASFVFAVIMAGMVVALLRVAFRPLPEAHEIESDGETLLSGLQAPQQISTHPGEVFEHNVNITSSEKVILYQAYSELGNNFTYRAVTPRYFSDPRWREIRFELLKQSPNGVTYGAVNQHDALYMTEAGEKWLGVKARPTAPQVEKSPENATEAEETQRNATQNDGEVVK